MPLYRIPKGQHHERLAAHGYMHDDPEALTPLQRECTNRFGIAVQLEQEAYLTQHPEISVMLKLFVSKVTSEYIKGKSQVDVMKEAGEFFTRPICALDEDIRHYLQIDAKDPFVKDTKPVYKYDGQFEMEKDLLAIVTEHHPPEPWDTATASVPTPDTLSSSFLSFITSATTLPTPEPIPTPEPTIYEIFYAMISNIVDKAIYSRVTEEMLRYDTAYVELMHRVEDAMEIPVQGVKDDLAVLLYNAYHYFELVIIEKENIAAQVAWEKRMRKKLKTTLRRKKNFKGYETPPTPKSSISSHESYLKPPMKPCICSPQFYYNRYKKDRFGIWLPRGEFRTTNITQTPVFSSEHIDGEDKDRFGFGTSQSGVEMMRSNITTTSAISSENVKPEVAGAEKTAQKKGRSSIELPRGERRTSKTTPPAAISSKSRKEEAEVSTELLRGGSRTSKSKKTLAASSKNLKENVGDAEKTAQEKFQDGVSAELPRDEGRTTNITKTPAVSSKNVTEEMGEEAGKTTKKKVDIQEN